MGQASQAWEQLSSMITSGDFDAITDIYAVDAIFLEPYNPPHRGNLLIQAYLKDYYSGKEKVAVDEVKHIETSDGTQVAIEWTLSYDAAGRRWNDLPRGTFIELDDNGLIAHHRDYS